MFFDLGRKLQFLQTDFDVLRSSYYHETTISTITICSPENIFSISEQLLWDVRSHIISLYDGSAYFQFSIATLKLAYDIRS